MMLLVYMLLGLTIWGWTISLCALPWGDYFSTPPADLSCLWFLSWGCSPVGFPCNTLLVKATLPCSVRSGCCYWSCTKKGEMAHFAITLRTEQSGTDRCWCQVTSPKSSTGDQRGMLLLDPTLPHLELSWKPALTSSKEPRLPPLMLKLLKHTSRTQQISLSACPVQDDAAHGNPKRRNRRLPPRQSLKL